MGLDHAAVFAKIQKCVVSQQSVSTCMEEVIAICERGLPHADWSRLSAIEFDSDVATLNSWIGSVFEKNPAPFPIQGIWVGLCNPRDTMKITRADMYIASMAEYDADDEELGWLWCKNRHYPEDAFSHSTSLKSIYEIAYGEDGGLGNDAEWPLCLAFGSLAVRTLLRGQSTQLVASNAKKIGVVVGFDSGDMLKIGELTDTGFVTA
jgi:hypothetical protein